MPHLTELILILIIMMVVFGMGRLPRIAESIGRAHSSLKGGGDGAREVIDITPNDPGSKTASKDRKPGRFEHKVEDAEVHPPEA